MPEKPVFKSINNKGDFINLIFNDLSNYKYAYFFSSGRKAKDHYPFKKVLGAATQVHGNLLRIKRSILGNKKYIAVRFTDRYGRESEPIVVHLKPTNLL